MTATTSSPTESRPVAWGLFEPRALVGHAVMLCLFGFAWIVDGPVSAAADHWYNSANEWSGEVRQLVISLAQYAQPIGYVLAGSLIWIFDRTRRGRVLLLAAAIVGSGLVSSAGKTLTGRERPRDSEGVHVFHGLVHSLPNSKIASFPSGHTASAFAMTMVLADLYPPARPIVWPLAVGVAANRIITVRHFPSDVVMGIWIGVAVGLITLRSRRLSQWVDYSSLRWERPFGLPSLPSGSWKEQLHSIANSRLLLVMACLVMFWGGNGKYSLWDRDEPRFATASREMAARGDWIVPTFNGDLRPDKPILIYWLQRSAYAVMGDGPFAARLWSGIGGTIACLLTWQLAATLFGPNAGRLAGWMLALSPMLIIESKLGTVDAVLLATIVGAMLTLWRIYSGPVSARVVAAFWIAIGLGILTKGPVALMVPGLVIVSLCVMDRKIGWLARTRPQWGLPLLFAIVLPWCFAVHSATQGEFLRQALGHHVVTRALQPLENHSGFPGYYVASLMGLMIPWSLLLPWSLFSLRSHLWRDARLRFLLAWGLTTLFAFEVVRTKLVHYYLPAYPAWVALIAGSLIGSFGTEKVGLVRFPIVTVGRAMMVLGAMMSILGPAATWTLLPSEIGLPAGVLLMISGLGLALAGKLYEQNLFAMGLRVQLAAGVVVIAIAGTQILPAVHSSQVILDVARRLDEVADQTPIALWYYRDPSIIYNTGRIIPVIDPLREKPPLVDARALAQKEGVFVCPVSPVQLESMQSDPELFVSVRETLSRWDIKSFRTQTVHLVEVRPAQVASQPAKSDNR